MSYIKIISIFLFTFNSFTFAAVEPSSLNQEAAKRAERVPEFAFIQEEANKLGVKVYLFGGTASAFAHYVRWDLEREAGDDKYQKERFDYDFTNIYRGNQDLDIVVDGTAEQAVQLQQVLKQKFPHFIGNKDAWEVRLLRAQIGDKLPLLDDEDFRNQHTDTNSTGMMDLTARSDEMAFRDLLDWDNPNSQFLKDVANSRIKFLFSDLHEETSRFKNGKNPPVFAAIRYLAKLAQYEVTEARGDLKLIRSIVSETNWKSIKSNYYVKHKLEEFGKKVLLNAPDSEYAWNLLERTGLRKKLIEMDGNRKNVNDSLSWWMNKEPLRSKPIGEGESKTAAQIATENGMKELIVAHETNNFQAYENITRSSKGRANAFISRNTVSGETAVFGNGFYTAIGTQGARGTNLTIRFKVDPEAREGEDFKLSGNYLIFNNKNALTLIQENINLTVIDFLKLMIGDGISRGDRGLIEKLNRKFSRQTLSEVEVLEVEGFVAENLDNDSADAVLKTLFSLGLEHSREFILDILDSTQSHEFAIENIIPTIKDSELKREVVDKLILNPEIDSLLIRNVLNGRFGFEYSDHIEVIARRADAYLSRDITSHILRNKVWKNRNKNILEIILSRKLVDSDIVTDVLEQDHFDSETKIYVLETLLNRDKTVDGGGMIPIVLSMKGHEKYRGFLKKIIEQGGSEYIITRLILDQTDPDLGDVELILKKGDADSHLAVYLLANYDSLYDDVLLRIIKNEGISKKIIEAVSHMIYQEASKMDAFDKSCEESVVCSLKTLPEWLSIFLEDTKGAVKTMRSIKDSGYSDSGKMHYIAILKFFVNKGHVDSEFIQQLSLYGVSSEDGLFNIWLDQILKRGKADNAVARYLLAKKEFKDREDVLRGLVNKGRADVEIAQYVLSKRFWTISDDLIDTIVNRGKADQEIIKYVLTKKHVTGGNREKWLDIIIERGNVDKIVIEMLFQRHNIEPKKIWIEQIISRNAESALTYSLSHEKWSKYPRLLKNFARKTSELGAVRLAISKRHEPIFKDLARIVIKRGKGVAALIRELDDFEDSWLEHIDIIEEIIKIDNEDVLSALIDSIFPHKYWVKKSKLIESVIKKANVEQLKGILTFLIKSKHWHKREDLILKILNIDTPIDVPYEGFSNFVEVAESKGHEAARSLVAQIMSYGEFPPSKTLVEILLSKKNPEINRAVIRLVSQEKWYKYIGLLEGLFRSGKYDNDFINGNLFVHYRKGVVQKTEWAIEIYKRGSAPGFRIINEVFPSKYFVKYHEFIADIIKKGEFDSNVAKLFKHSHWVKHHYLLKLIIDKGDNTNSVLINIINEVLSLETWVDQPELVESFIDQERFLHQITQSVFNKEHWTRHPDLLMKIIKVNKNKPTVKRYVLAKDYWVNHPVFKEFFGSKKITYDLLERKSSEFLKWYKKGSYTPEVEISCSGLLL